MRLYYETMGPFAKPNNRFNGYVRVCGVFASNLFRLLPAFEICHHRKGQLYACTLLCEVVSNWCFWNPKPYTLACWGGGAFPPGQQWCLVLLKQVPVGVANLPKELYHAPRAWAISKYNLKQWSIFNSGAVATLAV